MSSKIQNILSKVRSTYVDEFQEPITQGNEIEDLLTEIEFVAEKLIDFKQRQAEIIKHIIDCCSGNLYNPIPTSDKNDELDVISSGFNIYIEELTAATVSKEALIIANEELLKEKETSEKLAQAKDEFLSNMSHELRTPLNAIIGFTDLLLISKNLSDEQNLQLATIKNSSDKLLILVNHLLDLDNTKNISINSINKLENKRIKILVAEDNEINQLLIGTILKQENFEYTICENGKLAVELFEQYEFDIILMDLMMPIMNGYEACELIRRSLNPIKAKTPIIAISADVTKDVQEKCKEIGMNDYISKPYDAKYLINKIKQFVY